MYKVITTKLENNTYEYNLTDLGDNMVYATLTKNQEGGGRRTRQARHKRRTTRRRRSTRRQH